jgi:hypothetical protein
MGLGLVMCVVFGNQTDYYTDETEAQDKPIRVLA